MFNSISTFVKTSVGTMLATGLVSLLTVAQAYGAHAEPAPIKTPAAGLGTVAAVVMVVLIVGASMMTPHLTHND